MGDMADYYKEQDMLDGLKEAEYEDTVNTWITQDGRALRIEDMTDSHLDNAIKFLERRGAGAALKCRNWDYIDNRTELKLPEPTPVERAEGDMCQLDDTGVSRYARMLDEQRKRKVKKKDGTT